MNIIKYKRFIDSNVLEGRKLQQKGVSRYVIVSWTTQFNYRRVFGRIAIQI